MRRLTYPCGTLQEQDWFEHLAVFQPNLTTKLLINEVGKTRIPPKSRFLEIGCGSGVISKSLIDSGKISGDCCWLSDASEEAVLQARLTLKGVVAETHIVVGDCLEPWMEMTFDVIVSDVAGIANSIAMVSDWYRGVPYEAGEGGITNSLRILNDAKKILAAGGLFVFPLISLSNVEKLLLSARNTFKQVLLSDETWWPLPSEICAQTKMLEQLQSAGMITLRNKYGKVLAYTRVALCSDSSQNFGSVKLER